MTLPFLPNKADATFEYQSYPDSVDFEILLAGHKLTGVVSGCAVTQNAGTPDMSIDVASGAVRIDGKSIDVVAHPTNSIAAADATNPRIDLVTINGDGTAIVTNGTAAAEDVVEAPQVPDGHVALAFVYVPANDTVVTNNQIVDKRVFIPVRTVYNVLDYGAVGDGVTDDTGSIQAAYYDLYTQGGGVLLYPSGYSFRGYVTLNQNVPTLVSGYGATLIPLDSNPAININAGNSNTAEGITIQGVKIDGDGVTAPYGIAIRNTDRVRIRDVRIESCSVGIRLYTGASGWVEGTAITHSWVDSCTTGILFDPVEGTSFGETAMFDVGINNCTTGIKVANTANIYRSQLLGVTVWLNSNQTAYDFQGDFKDVTAHLAVEALGTPTGATGFWIAATAYNLGLAHIRASFTGSINTEIGYAAGAPYLLLDEPSKLNEFNVHAYGARGDGSTDDTAAIQAAIDAANAAGGGVVTFGPNSYVHTGLDIYSNITLQGANNNETLLLHTTSNDPSISNGPGTQIYSVFINDIYFYRSSGSPTYCVDWDLIAQGGMTNVKMGNYTTGYGLRLNGGGSLYNNFHNVYVPLADNALLITGGANLNRFWGCRFSGNATDGKGVIIDYGNNNEFFGCSSEAGSIGVSLEGTTSTLSNHFYGHRLENLDVGMQCIGSAVRGNSMLFPHISTVTTPFSDTSTWSNTFIATGSVAQADAHLQINDGSGIYWVSGDPEGSLAADPGSIAYRDDGKVYIKTTGTGNTGWRVVITVPVVEEDTNFTVDPDVHRTINVDSSGGVVTVTLPSAAAASGVGFVIRRDGGSNVVINRAGSDTFDDAATSKTLGSDGAGIGILSVGDTEWKIVGSNGTVT